MNIEWADDIHIVPQVSLLVTSHQLGIYVISADSILLGRPRYRPTQYVGDGPVQAIYRPASAGPQSWALRQIGWLSIFEESD